MNLNLKELKEIGSLNYVVMMEAYDSLTKELMSVFLVLPLQSNYLKDLKTTVDHRLMVTVCLAQAAALSDCANVEANVLDDDGKVQFLDDSNDATVTDDLKVGADFHEAMAQEGKFDEALLDGSQ